MVAVGLFSFLFVVLFCRLTIFGFAKMRTGMVTRRVVRRPRRFDDETFELPRRTRRRAAVRIRPEECFNCHRRNINLRKCERDAIRSRRGYCTFSITKIPKKGGSCQLCGECFTYLTRPTEQEPTNKLDWAVIWPAFMWKFLSDTSAESAIIKCGVQETWMFVPLKWRCWWLQSLVEHFPAFWALPGLSLDAVIPHFVDVTDDLQRFEDMLDTLRLGDIRNLCNELNFPTVYCPWGCSTFLQDVGALDLAAVFHHVLRKRRVKVAMVKKSKEVLPFCLSMRPDFLDPRRPRHLLCPKFEVCPSVGLHRSGGMCVLTCALHSGGTRDRYYHLPRARIGLMSGLGDQLAHCVVHHRTVKPMAPKRFNNTYQLFEQRGSFNGIGMACLKTNGDF